MNSVQNPHHVHLKSILKIVRLAWESYHPSQIADLLNARYGFYGVYRMDARHIENYHQMIIQLDREGDEG